MGDLPDPLPLPNGTLNDRRSSPTTLSFSFPDPQQHLPVGSVSLHAAELATCEIVDQIQPTVVSEERRKAVISYVQRLVRSYLGSELFPFGSVPLKTYLPDGDIDLTALSSPNAEEALSGDVYGVLEAEEGNQFAEFEVKDVQYIQAEVKLVKCLIQNIVVDISFNQLGGLGTLCFLEQVDRLVGKGSLFKRSIILIKAWCYYESRILGAHHGLISTYALETLVLYIFHFFHPLLDGPLAVLYRFLDYFSKFNWENYCLSLYGPVAVSSLPEIVVDIPENDGGNLLLTKDFLKNCKEMTAIPPRLLETRPRPFPRKHLNIIDPMKENNNLGRSVSKGNLYRIRSAFTYGAKRLGRILSLPPENIGDEVKKFFQNTLDRHGNGQRPDVHDSISRLPFGINGRCADSSDVVDFERHDENGHVMSVGQSLSSSGDSTNEDNEFGHTAMLVEKVKNIKISEFPKNGVGSEILNHSKSGEVSTDSESITSFNESCMGVDAPDVSAMRESVMRTTNDAFESSAQVCSKVGSSTGAIAQHGPHFRFPQASSEEKLGMGKLDQSRLAYPISYLEPSSTPQPYNKQTQPFEYGTRRSYSFPNEFVASRSYINSFRGNTVSHPSLVSSTSSNALDRDFQGLCSEGLGSLADLSGDYDYHLKSLLYAQYCHEYIWGTPVLPIPSQPLPVFRSNPSWDSHRYSQKRCSFPHGTGVIAGNRFSPGSGYYPVTAPIVAGAFNVEEIPKPRGTGTYFPIMNHRSYKEWQSSGRGRNGPPGQSPASNNYLRPRINNRLGSPPDSGVVLQRGSHETQPPQLSLPVSPSLSPSPSPSPSPLPSSSPPLLPQQLVFGVSGHKKSGPADFVSVHRPVAIGQGDADGFAMQPEVEFGTFGPVQFGKLFPEQSKHVDDVASKPPHASSPIGPASAAQRSGWSMTQERVLQTYHLKNEDDFPPLG